MAKVLIKKLDPAVELPAYKTEGASGMDLMALVKEPINLKPNSSCLVPTGLAVAFSSDFEIQIRPRSGLAAKKNITVLNTPGTIDSDYRGEIKVIIYNHGDEKFLVNNGDRIAPYHDLASSVSNELNNEIIKLKSSITNGFLSVKN